MTPEAYIKALRAGGLGPLVLSDEDIMQAYKRGLLIEEVHTVMGRPSHKSMTRRITEYLKGGA